MTTETPLVGRAAIADRIGMHKATLARRIKAGGSGKPPMCQRDNGTWLGTPSEIDAWAKKHGWKE